MKKLNNIPSPYADEKALKVLRATKTLSWPIVKRIQSKINTTQLTIPMNEIKKIKIKNEKKMISSKYKFKKIK